MYIKITSTDGSRHYIKRDQISLVMKDINNRCWIQTPAGSIEINIHQHKNLTEKLDELYNNIEIKQPIPLMDKVEDLQLSVRTANCFINAEIKYLYQILKMTDADLLKLKNFGRKQLNEIKEVLKEKYNTEIGALKC